MIYCSQKFFDELKSYCESESTNPVGLPCDPLTSIPIRVSAFLPYILRRVESRDELCEYEWRDRWWAEPLGLAKYHEEEIHVLEI